MWPVEKLLKPEQRSAGESTVTCTFILPVTAALKEKSDVTRSFGRETKVSWFLSAVTWGFNKIK